MNLLRRARSPLRGSGIMAPNRSCRRASSNPATWHQGPTQAARPPPLLDLAQVPRIWRARRLDTGGGVLCAFPARWTRYLDSVSAARLVQVPLSLLFLE